MDRLDDLSGVADHVAALDQRAADGEYFTVGLLLDGDEVVGFDVGVGLDDARPHHVRAVGDEGDGTGVDGDDALRRRMFVGTADGEERFVVDVEHEWFAVDEDDVELRVGEFDQFVAVAVEVDTEVRRHRVLDGRDVVAAQVVAGFDLHTPQIRRAVDKSPVPSRGRLGSISGSSRGRLGCHRPCPPRRSGRRTAV